jgi:hypothetical protein
MWVKDFKVFMEMPDGTEQNICSVPLSNKETLEAISQAVQWGFRAGTEMVEKNLPEIKFERSFFTE